MDGQRRSPEKRWCVMDAVECDWAGKDWIEGYRTLRRILDETNKKVQASTILIGWIREQARGGTLEPAETLNERATQDLGFIVPAIAIGRATKCAWIAEVVCAAASDDRWENDDGYR